MTPKTKQILKQLLEEHSARTLTVLWADISRLDEGAFQTALKELTSGKASKKPGAKKAATKKARSLPANDAPATRVAHQLRLAFGNDDVVAAKNLAEALARSGVRQQIPHPIPGQQLEDWLNELFVVVSDAKVFATAKRLKSAP